GRGLSSRSPLFLSAMCQKCTDRAVPHVPPRRVAGAPRVPWQALSSIPVLARRALLTTLAAAGHFYRAVGSRNDHPLDVCGVESKRFAPSPVAAWHSSTAEDFLCGAFSVGGAFPRPSWRWDFWPQSFPPHGWWRSRPERRRRAPSSRPATRRRC